MDSIYTQFCTELINHNWGQAIELLDTIRELNPDGFADWLARGSTTKLMKLATPYKNFSIYSQRVDPLPFDNDVYAIDAVWLTVKKKS